MRVAGLFAGIGGFELGLQRSGHVAELFSEISPTANAVLSARFPETPNLGSVSTITSLPSSIELLTGGFPCQDLSQAGRTAGIRGPKSGLVGEIFRIVDINRPPSVLLENVSFMLHLDSGAAMNLLVEAFEERGYRWAYRVVSSLAFLPQRRERVFFLASRDFDPADVVLADEASEAIRETSLDTHAHGFYWTEGTRGLGWAPDGVPTLKNGSSVGIPAPPAILFPNGLVGKPQLADAERLQGFPADWTLPASEVARESWRWSLVGNAVSVPVSAWIGERLKSPGAYDRSRDLPLKGNRWPDAARFDGTRRSGVKIGKYPVWEYREPLTEFLQFDAVPLSIRATAGFLKRLNSSSLRIVPGFRERVSDHLVRMQNHHGNLLIAAE